MEKIFSYPEIPFAERFSAFFSKDFALRSYYPIVEPYIQKIKSDYQNQLREKDKEIIRLKRDFVESRVVVIEEMNMKTAEGKVIDFMKEHKNADLDYLFENLHIDIEQLLVVVDKLVKDGRIRVASK